MELNKHDQSKELHHHKLNKHNKWHPVEEDQRIVVKAMVAVVHYDLPIIANRALKEQEQRMVKVREISLRRVDGISRAFKSVLFIYLVFSYKITNIKNKYIPTIK